MKYPFNNWYVLQTIVKKEKKTKEKIERLNLEELQTLLPLRKLSIKRKGEFHWEYASLFPGYFFIRKKLQSDDIKKIARLDGVVKILPNSKNPAPIPEEDIKLILTMMNKDEDIISESRVFYEDEKVVVKAGPLMNMEGRIVSVDKRKKRITLRLPFFNAVKDVQFSFELIEKTGGE